VRCVGAGVGMDGPVGAELCGCVNLEGIGRQEDRARRGDWDKDEMTARNAES